eukprot:jgi/Botrbrau1/1283/Bobra.0163s0065.1
MTINPWPAVAECTDAIEYLWLESMHCSGSVLEMLIVDVGFKIAEACACRRQTCFHKRLFFSKLLRRVEPQRS